MPWRRRCEYPRSDNSLSGVYTAAVVSIPFAKTGGASHLGVVTARSARGRLISANSSIGNRLIIWPGLLLWLQNTPKGRL